MGGDGLTAWEREAEWFRKNIREAKPEDIGPSDVPCPRCAGVSMEKYKGTEFVDWTHLCPECGVMYGCA